MNLAFVVQRYGADISGGSEAHCRGLVNALRSRHHVEVLTTCARNYITWENHDPPGRHDVDGVTVTRYRTDQPRNIERFDEISDFVFHEEHQRADEQRWIVENGPVSRDLIRAVSSRRDIDFFLLYAFRYYTAAMSAATVPGRAVLVPTAEDDDAVRLGVFAEMFRSVRGLLFLTPEEQELVESVSGPIQVPSAIIGGGLTLPAADRAAAERFSLPSSYVAYVGRIDRNKGVHTLFQYYQWLANSWPDVPTLVVAGHHVLDIPVHPKIRYLGYVSDAEKSAVIAGASLVVMPSAYESLSILALEAWALGTPVLANAQCRVLEGQCRRSGGGLYYRNFAEFSGMLRLLMSRDDLRRDLGAAGEAYIAREYSWEIAAKRTEETLERIRSGVTV